LSYFGLFISEADFDAILVRCHSKRTAVPRDQTRHISAYPVRLNGEVRHKLEMLWFLRIMGSEQKS